jgi:CHASE3 domain sensor protein
MNPHPAQVKQALRKVRLFFVMMAALLTGGITASYFAGRAALNATEKVRQFDGVIEGMQDLRSTVQDAETGQRGYLLTREAGYLGPYEEAIATLQRKLETVQKMAEAEFCRRSGCVSWKA